MNETTANVDQTNKVDMGPRYYLGFEAGFAAGLKAAAQVVDDYVKQHPEVSPFCAWILADRSARIRALAEEGE